MGTRATIAIERQDRREYLAERGEAYDYLFTKEKEWLITKHRSFSLYPLNLYLATTFSKNRAIQHV